jgi:6,7-dimethyl-8-ribityllumazine synthase
MSEFTPVNIFPAGIPLKKDACVVLVQTAWNQKIVGALREGCVRKLEHNNIQFEILTVPGAFEIPFGIKKHYEMAKQKPDAYIALGCVLRGDTPHFDYVCKAVTDGIVQLNLMLPIPTIFGVLTVDTEEQAIQRIGGKHGHKGEEAAETALAMISLFNN